MEETELKRCENGIIKENGKHWNGSVNNSDHTVVNLDDDIELTTERTQFLPLIENGLTDTKPSTQIEPEHWKTLFSFTYMCIGTYFLTFILTIVHDRMPNQEKYPPLPDLILDNIPLTPWAGEVSEGIITVLGIMFVTIVFFHQHRFIILRRFFCITGTLYLLRSATISVTSLPETGQHVDCSANFTGSAWSRLLKSTAIFIKLGMASTGGRTCGAYMFSGHAMVITNFTFFITQYTPRSFWLLHVIIWMMSVSGMFAILAAHGHYTVDVIVAFYLTCRMFLYYHTLAVSRTTRARYKRWHFWFPMVRFLESKMEGNVPNEYNWPLPKPVRLVEYFEKHSTS
ncbi:sphingomyelin synthase-related protein 1-like [Glandiceps talaboti]